MLWNGHFAPSAGGGKPFHGIDVFVKWKLRFSVCPQARYDALLASSCAGSRTSRTHLSFLSTTLSSGLQ